MKQLPGDVFVAGQVLPEELQAFADQGIKSFINNRPDFETSPQPLSETIQSAAEASGLGYRYLPMSGGLSMELIEGSVSAFKELPRPIVAFCASGMRSAALWAFAHVEELGVDGVMNAMSTAGFNLEQIRQPLSQFLDSKS